jgi:3-hydroxybutyryl-CoA dehydratase
MVGETVSLQARMLAWTDLQQGRVAEWEFTVSEADMTAFALLSGDTNPLHTDDAFARSRGFEGRVVYGALLSAQLSRLVGMEMPGRDGVFVGMNVTFAKPVYVGRPVMLKAEIAEVSEAASLFVIKFQLRSDDRLVAKGKVEAILRHG